MPNKSDIKKLSKPQREFYTAIFSSKFVLPPPARKDGGSNPVLQAMQRSLATAVSRIRRRPAEAISAFMFAKTTPEDLQKLSTPSATSITAAFVRNAHMLLLGQEKRVQELVVESSVNAFIEVLKSAYDSEGEKVEENADFFWNLIKEALQESTHQGYDPVVVEQYFVNYYTWYLYLYDIQMDHVHRVMQRLIVNAFSLLITDQEECQSAISHGNQALEKICEDINKLYRTITRVDMTISSLAGAGALVVAAPALFYGIPWVALATGLSGMGGMFFLRRRAQRDPKFVEKVENYLIQKGEKNFFKEFGVRGKGIKQDKYLKRVTEKQWRQYFIDSAVNELLDEIQGSLTWVKSEYCDGKGDREIHVPSYDFPTIQRDLDIQRQQKIGPIPTTKPLGRIMPQRRERKVDEKKPERKVQLPDDTTGELVHGRNNSLIILKPASDNRLRDQITGIKLPQGWITAHMFGQSGLKYGEGDTLRLKDKNSGVRVIYCKVGEEKVNVDGVPQKVPVYEPRESFRKK